jgi:hypothetical protein
MAMTDATNKEVSDAITEMVRSEVVPQRSTPSPSTASSVPPAEKTTAETLVEKHTAMTNELHDFAIEEIDNMIARLNAVKDKISLEKATVINHASSFIGLINDSMLRVQEVGRVVDHLEDRYR